MIEEEQEPIYMLWKSEKSKEEVWLIKKPSSDSWSEIVFIKITLAI